MADPTRPGSVPPRERDTNDRIAKLEQQVSELLARDMTNATVGQGGTFRGIYDNGQLAFTFGKDRDDGVRKAKFLWPSTGKEAFQIGPGNPNTNPPEAEQMRWRDQSGNIVFGTDGVAGYGFVEPLLNYPAYAIPGLNYVAATPQQCTECQSFFYNAAIWSQIRVRAFTGTITSVTAELRLRHSDGTSFSSSATAAISANGTANRMILVPESFISEQFTYCDWWLTANGAGTVEVWPIQQRGVSRVYYDIRADLH